MIFARGVRAGPDRGAEWQPAMRTSWATVMGIAKALGLGSWWDPREGQSGPRGSRGKEAARSSGAGEECVFPHLCDGWPVMRFIPGSEAIVFLFAEARAVGGCSHPGPRLGDLAAGCCSHPGEQGQWTLTLQEWPGWGVEGQGWRSPLGGWAPVGSDGIATSGEAS